jgi:putative ABC transport system substrate-binding protein
MKICLRRRDFIAALGGAAAWPLAARAQQRAMPVVGYLLAGTPEANVGRVAAFRRGLGEVGYVEGLNVAIEYRWGQNQPDRLAELAADLVRRRVSVIATVPSTQAALAAKAATKTVPIVFAVGSDPIALGLVASLNRPGGNATGISFQSLELVAKRLGQLRELAPAATRFVALVNPNAAFADTVVRDLQTSAQSLGLSVEVLRAGTVREIDAAFGDLVQSPGIALLISPDEFLVSRRAQIVTLAARHALPTTYPVREYSDIGGLMSYGPNIENACQQAGVYAGRILKGEKPADLPVQQPTKFELVVNLSTARALAIVIPNTLLALADEVIE